MCDDSKWAKKPEATTSGDAEKQQSRGGKPSGIKDLKICPQLDRTKWCQMLPRCHDEKVCHQQSQRRRKVLDLMKQLVDAHVDSPVCPEWDTSETCENTPGPYRFGVEKPSQGNENYKIIYSNLQKGCDCIKRNGLQDDCRLPRCQGSPACKITPFPRCEPFLGIPSSTSQTSRGYQNFAGSSGNCKCPSAAVATGATTPTGKNVLIPSPDIGRHQNIQHGHQFLSEGQCLCICR